MSDPSGFKYDSITCTPSGSATINNATRTATITLGIGGSVVCVVQNNQQLGAIKITKKSSKAAGTLLANAHFEICTNNGPYTVANPCSPAKTGSGDLVTGSGGTVCIDNLTFADYYVTEKTAPSGYSIDDTTTTKVTVGHNAKCSDATYVGEAKTYLDTPLTDLVVTATSEVPATQTTAAGSASRITCTGPSPGTGNIGNSPVPSATTFVDPATMTANGLKPGTYTCTVVIDP